MTDLEKLFNPRAIGIIGVSNKPYGGGFFLTSLKNINFKKPIYIFNPRLKGQEIMGIKVYGSILELNENQPIDYVIIAVPAENCPNILREVGQKRIPFVTIFTSGFSEIGRNDLEKDILEIARQYNIRILGPNCVGVFVPKNNLAFSTRVSEESGNFGMILQSGGLAIQLSSMAQSIYGIPPSKVISIGNQIDLNFIDFLQYFYTDPETRVIALYLENFKNKHQGREFLTITKKLSLSHKPVILWKVGSGQSSIEAIKSHTGGLAGSQAIWKTIAKQTGILLVNNAQELENLAMTFHFLQDLSVNRNLGVIAIGGGASIQVTDVLEQYNLEIPKLSTLTTEKIKDFLPEVNTIIRNPLDLGSSGINPEIFTKTLITLENDPNISAILFVWVFNFDDIILKLLKKAYYQMKKPFICLSYDIVDDNQYYNEKLRFKRELFKLKIPFFESIELMAKSLDKLCSFKEFLENYKNFSSKP